eukprot:scaffold141005_cov35-Tisochrysis_lutea.AAC.1
MESVRSAALLERDRAAVAAKAAADRARHACAAASKADDEVAGKAAALGRAAMQLMEAQDALKEAEAAHAQASLALDDAKARSSAAQSEARTAQSEADAAERKASEAAAAVDEIQNAAEQPGWRGDSTAGASSTGPGKDSPAPSSQIISGNSNEPIKRRILPEWVTWKQDVGEIAFILEVPRILENTLKIDVATRRLCISFYAHNRTDDKESNRNSVELSAMSRTFHSVVIDLGGDVDTRKLRKHVADLNMMLVITKMKQGQWSDLQVAESDIKVPENGKKSLATWQMYELD